MKDLDFSNQIRAKLYPIEESDDSVLAAERFGGKKRSKLKDSDFLDSTRRSFPVMSCKDVKDAVSTWGMYKGPMSFDAFKSKLKSRAKKLGCDGSLPKSWDNEAKSGIKGGKSNYEKIDKKELKRDTKKEKEEHEKDAVKDDDSKIKKLKKEKPSVKKDVEIHDLKKDERFDKTNKTKDAKAGLPPWLKKKGGDDEDEDKKELKKDSKKEKEEHEKDAVKDDKKQIKDLKKDEKEDKKAEKKDKK